MYYRLLIIVFISVLLMGCSVHKTRDDLVVHLDSLETFNRKMFYFNYKVLDPYILKPVAIVWKDSMPRPARNILGNFFSNLQEPATTVNYFIQGKPYKGFMHFNRFLLNTLLGMGGFIDVASMANQKLTKEEPRRFCTTLGMYGIGYGTYIYIPGYGSFTPREDIGSMVDNLYPMLSYLTWWMSAIKWLLESIEVRAQLLEADYLLINLQDPYSILRTAYFQSHDFLADDGFIKPPNNHNEEFINRDISSIDSQ